MEYVDKKVINTFIKELNGRRKADDVKVYYKISGGNETTHIISVTPKDDERLQDKIYSAQLKTLKKHKGDDVSFRVIPKYNLPLKSIISKDFIRYA